jgi:hypothetical protein
LNTSALGTRCEAAGIPLGRTEGPGQASDTDFEIDLDLTDVMADGGES